MDIIKNKDKELTFVNVNDVMNYVLHYFIDDEAKNKEFWDSIDFGVVKCKLVDIDMEVATFQVISIENIKEVVNIIIEQLINMISSYRDKTPNRVLIMFGGYSFHYYSNDNYGPINEHIDAAIKKIKVSSFKTRIKNHILKVGLQVPHEKIDDTVCVLEDLNGSVESVIDPFPIKEVHILNYILNEYTEDNTFFDLELIGDDEDLVGLLNWELDVDSGVHRHDGDTIEYVATFTSPNGTKYTFSDEMSLMGNGWGLTELGI